jgi:3-deoxy-7-phosphoheptulonate synthase
MLRGGAYKPALRLTSSGFRNRGAEILREAREQTGLPVVTEVMSTEDVDVICEYADMLR